MGRLLRLGLFAGWLLGQALGSAHAQVPAVASSPDVAYLGAVTVTVAGEVPQDRPTIPCLRLGSGQALEVTFDLLDQPARSLNYRLRQQSASWQPSHQPESAYLTGFPTGLLEPPTPSAGTLHAYQHYRLLLPQLASQLKQSGNYQLEVFDTDSPDAPLLVVPFLVVEEQGLRVSTRVDEARLGSDSEGKQQVDLRLTLPSTMGVSLRDLQVVVLQNARWDNAARLSSPSYASLEEVRYEAEQGARFEGGNTYLKLEHLTDEAQGLGVAACLQTDSGTLLRLLPFREPGAKLFRADPAHQGLERLRSLDTEDVSTEGEYHWANFRLVMPRLSTGAVVLVGDAFRYLPERMRQLEYDMTQGAYTATLLLKSGYQEYQYLLSEGEGLPLRSTPLVGSHRQTANSYTALVYLRRPGDRHDRLLSYQPL